jgi:hypothetical protein
MLATVASHAPAPASALVHAQAPVPASTLVSAHAPAPTLAIQPAPHPAREMQPPARTGTLSVSAESRGRALRLP